MDHEFSYRLFAAADRIKELILMPPVQLEEREAFLLAQLLHRAGQEVMQVEALRAEVGTLKRKLQGKD